MLNLVGTVIAMFYYLQGLSIGLAYLAPIGMQNLFVINSALTQKQARALLTALIVMFFDVTLALSCFFGIGKIMEILPFLRPMILLVGGLLVLYIGVKLFMTKPSSTLRHDTAVSLTQTASTACIVTWFNPQALIDGTMLMGAFQATLPPQNIVHFLLGMTSASVLWFFGLTLFVSIFSDKFTPRLLHHVNRLCSIIIAGYGTNLLYQFTSLIL
jgi:L-lysine exporter family protein LysE/ArgO